MDPRPTVSERVVQRVAAKTNRDPTALPPLYEAIDPDGLEDVIAGLDAGELTFAYAGCEVTVDSEGSVTADERFTRGSSREVATSDD
ncbi:HalOD1 output domain-containing protein [Halobellus sp. GM3]|uniref:HalOD1 output domain-containing protein n=1 Tax=Halobellus sp. GM3 TaxID=3458410 RepID=UPI00403D5878